MKLIKALKRVVMGKSKLEDFKERYAKASNVERQLLLEYTPITASSLSRIYQYVNDPDISFGMISGFTPEYDYEENVKRTKELASKVRSAGFGYIWLEGYWVPEGKSEPEKEYSILVTARKNEKKLKSKLTSLMKEYGQEAIAWKAEKDPTIIGIFEDGSTVEFGKFRPDKMGEIYSKILRGGHANRPFVFSSFHGRRTPSSAAFYLNYLKDAGL